MNALSAVFSEKVKKAERAHLLLGRHSPDFSVFKRQGASRVKPRRGGCMIFLSLFIFIVGLVAHQPVLAKSGGRPVSVPVGRSVVHVVAPPQLETPKDFYLTYFGSLDYTFYKDHLDAWNYHYIQRQFASTISERSEHLKVGSSKFRSVEEVRREEAERVFRIRVDRVFRKLFEKSKSSQKVQQVVQKMKNVRIGLTGADGAKVTEFHVGYDIFTDGSKIEFVGSGISAGFYHPYLLGSLTQSKPSTGSAATFRVSANLEKLPNPSVSYKLSGEAIDISVAEAVSSNVSIMLSSQYPLRRSPSSLIIFRASSAVGF